MCVLLIAHWKLLRVLYLPFTPSLCSTGMTANSTPPVPKAKFLPHSLHSTCQLGAKPEFFLLLSFILTPPPHSLTHPQEACRVLFSTLIYLSCPHAAPTSLQKLSSSALGSDSSASLLKAFHHTENQAHVPHFSRTFHPVPCSLTGRSPSPHSVCVTHPVPFALIHVRQTNRGQLGSVAWALFLITF